MFDSAYPEWMNAILSTCFERWGKISDTHLPDWPACRNVNGDFMRGPTCFEKKPVNLLKPWRSFPSRFVNSGL